MKRPPPDPGEVTRTVWRFSDGAECVIPASEMDTTRYGTVSPHGERGTVSPTFEAELERRVRTKAPT